MSYVQFNYFKPHSFAAISKIESSLKYSYILQWMLEISKVIDDQWSCHIYSIKLFLKAKVIACSGYPFNSQSRMTIILVARES